MELPFTIVFEPPSQAELRALFRIRGYWVAGSIVALAIGTAYLLANVAHADAVAAQALLPLAVTSQPSGASVWVDGRARGNTPVQLAVEAGPHEVVLKTPDALDSRYAVDVSSSGTSLNALLWSREPQLTRLRPTLPGAVLADARFLEDGQIALSIALPPGRQMEAWRLDPESGALSMLMDGIWGARVSVAPNGVALAYVGTEVGPAESTLSAGSVGYAPAPQVLWLVHMAPGGATTATTGWRPQLDTGEQLVDATWSPQAERLLVFATRSEDDARRTRAWFVDADGESAQAVLSVPSAIIPGTEAWSPDGQHVAFVAHTADVNALCLLSVDGSFRYLADLEPSSAGPLAYPPLIWSADGRRILFAAPRQHPPGVAFDWLPTETPRSLYVASLDQPTPTAWADTPVGAAAWREDGQVLGLWRPGSDSPLSIRLLNASGGSGQGLVELPLKTASDFGALWDLPRANLLVALRGGTGTEYWLAQLGVGSNSR